MCHYWIPLHCQSRVTQERESCYPGVCSNRNLVPALHISSKEMLTLYSHPEVLWVICPVMLYWITRAWMLTYRNSIDDAPAGFAMRDQQS